MHIKKPFSNKQASALALRWFLSYNYLMKRNYGELMPRTIGLAMKEMVRRVILSIREHRVAFEVSEKRGLDGKWDDLVTNVDKEAQDIYVNMMKENFPKFGIVAEEEYLRVEPAKEFKDVYFTIDPLDGTRAFIRKQSHGIGTMISLIYGDEVVAAYVGDVMTEEVYGFSPESDSVYRISDFGSVVSLSESLTSSKNQYITLRRDPRTYSNNAKSIINSFKGITVETGSIGTHASDIWKGVVGAMILEPGFQTPWDTMPIVGISKKLDLHFYRINEKKIEEIDMPIIKEPYETDFEILITSKYVAENLF